MKKNKKIILTGVLAGIGPTAMAPFVISSSEQSVNTQQNLNDQQIEKFKQQIKELIEAKTYKRFTPGITAGQKTYLLNKLDSINDYQSYTELRKEVLKMYFESIQVYSNLIIFTFGGTEFSQNTDELSALNNTIEGGLNTYKLLSNPEYLENETYKNAFENYKLKNSELWDSYKNTNPLSSPSEINSFLNEAFNNYEIFKDAVLALPEGQGEDKFKYLKFLFKDDFLYDTIIKNFTFKSQKYFIDGDPNNWTVDKDNELSNIQGGIITSQLVLVIGMLRNENDLLLFLQTDAQENQINTNITNFSVTKWLGYFNMAYSRANANGIIQSRQILYTNNRQNRIYVTYILPAFANIYKHYYNNDINFSQSTNLNAENIYKSAQDILDKFYRYSFFVENFNFKYDYIYFTFNLYKTGSAFPENFSGTVFTKQLNNSEVIGGGKTKQVSAYINLSGSTGNLNFSDTKLWTQFSNLTSTDGINRQIQALNGQQLYDDQKSNIEQLKTSLQNIIDENTNNKELSNYYQKIIDEINNSNLVVDIPTLEALATKATNYNNQVEQFKQLIELENAKNDQNEIFNNALTPQQKDQLNLIKEKLVSGSLLSQDTESSLLQNAVDNLRILPEINIAKQTANTNIEEAKKKLEEYKNLLTPQQYSDLNSKIQSLESTLTSNNFSAGQDNNTVLQNIKTSIESLDQALEIAKQQNDAAAQELSDYKLQTSSKIDELIQSVQTNPHSLLDESQKEEII
ncbi:hypothetical protein V2E24_00005, partial [Mycoplasmopsis ciconiae]|nr:hypothetical protein [Mycoplasmopsis ciconiae]